MKRSLFGKTLAAALLCLVVSVLVPAQVRALQDGDFTYEQTATTVTITGYTGAGGVVTIPAKIDNRVVVRIGESSFENNQTITKVVLPEGLIEIYPFAFSGCTNLASVSFPSTLFYLAQGAFANCPLTSVDLPEGLHEIEESTFAGARFTTVTIPKGLVFVNRLSFERCMNLQTIKVAEGNETFFSQDGLLCECNDRTGYQKQLVICPAGKTGNLILPDWVTGISIGTFYYSKLTSVTLPDTLTHAWKAFNHCSNLTTINIPGGVTTLLDTFDDCPKLRTITLGSGIRTIAGSALADLPALASVSIPATVTTIESGAFASCGKLSQVYFAGDAPAMGKDVFKGCAANLTIYYLKGNKGFTNPWLGHPTKVYTGPATPTGIKAGSAGYTSMKISWSKVPDATGYQVYRATSKTGTYKRVADTTATGYTDKSLTTGKTYYYKVRAYRTIGATKVAGAYSPIVSAAPKPAAPAGVAAVRVSNSSIKVSWKKVSGATQYQLYRATSKTGTYTKIKETTSLSYTNKGLKDNKTYYYKVRAYHTENGKKVYGSWSSVVKAKP